VTLRRRGLYPLGATSNLVLAEHKAEAPTGIEPGYTALQASGVGAVWPARAVLGALSRAQFALICVGWGDDRPSIIEEVGAVDCSEMQGGEHSSIEPTIAVKVPCQECGGRGYLETVTEGGQVVGHATKECLTCSGQGLIPQDMPLSQFRELLASHFG
jgi:hypothetical protein